MKKSLLFIFLLALSVSFSACGDNKEKNEADNRNVSQQSSGNNGGPRMLALTEKWMGTFSDDDDTVVITKDPKCVQGIRLQVLFEGKSREFTSDMQYEDGKLTAMNYDFKLNGDVLSSNLVDKNGAVIQKDFKRGMPPNALPTHEKDGEYFVPATQDYLTIVEQLPLEKHKTYLMRSLNEEGEVIAEKLKSVCEDDAGAKALAELYKTDSQYSSKTNGPGYENVIQVGNVVYNDLKSPSSTIYTKQDLYFFLRNKGLAFKVGASHIKDQRIEYWFSKPYTEEYMQKMKAFTAFFEKNEGEYISDDNKHLEVSRDGQSMSKIYIRLGDSNVFGRIKFDNSVIYVLDVNQNTTKVHEITLENGKAVIRTTKYSGKDVTLSNFRSLKPNEESMKEYAKKVNLE